jgi:hypothetical protein
MFPIDQRPARAVVPAADPEEEETKLRVEFLDLGFPLEEASGFAREGIRGLAFDEGNGDPLWTLPDGRVVRGGGGRLAAVEQIAEREHLRSFGPDPEQEAYRQLKERGVSAKEAQPHLQHRLRRAHDGAIEFATGAGVRTGGTDLIAEAVRRAYDAVQADRQARATATLEPDIRGRMRRI